MRTNIQALAVDYALKQYPLEIDSNIVSYNLTNEELREDCKEKFEVGFKTCLELVTPLLQSRISKDLFGKNNEDIKQFLETYKQ